jgi:hypothetical protein
MTNAGDVLTNNRKKELHHEILFVPEKNESKQLSRDG